MMESGRASQGRSPAPAGSIPLHHTLSYTSAPSTASSPPLQTPSGSSVLATLPFSCPPPQRPLRKACDECHLIKVKCTPLTASSEQGPSSPQLPASSPPTDRSSGKEPSGADAERSAPVACQRCHRLGLICKFSPADIKTRRKRRKREEDHHDDHSSASSAQQSVVKRRPNPPRDELVSSAQNECPWSKPSPSAYASIDASQRSSGKESAHAIAQPKGVPDRGASPFALNFPIPPSVQDFEANEWEGWFRDLPMFAPSLVTAGANNGAFAPGANASYGHNAMGTSASQATASTLSNDAPSRNASLGTSINGGPFDVGAGAMVPSRGLDERAGGEQQDQESIMRLLFGLDPCFAPQGDSQPGKDAGNVLDKPGTTGLSSTGTTASHSSSPWAPASTSTSHSTSTLSPLVSFEGSQNAQSSPNREPSLQDLANAALLERPHHSAESTQQSSRRPTLVTPFDSPQSVEATKPWGKTEVAASQTSTTQSHDVKEPIRMPPDRSIEARLSSLSVDFSSALDLCDPSRMPTPGEDQSLSGQRHSGGEPADTKRREGESRLLPLFVRADELWEEMVWWGSVRVGKVPGSSAGPRAGQRIQQPLSPAASMLTLSLSFQMLDALRLLSAIIEAQGQGRSRSREGTQGDTIPACRPFLASASGDATSRSLSSLISPYRLHSSPSTPTNPLGGKDPSGAQPTSAPTTSVPNAQSQSQAQSPSSLRSLSAPGRAPTSSLDVADPSAPRAPSSATATAAAAAGDPPCFPLPTSLHLPLLTALRDHYMSRFTMHLSTVIDQARVWHDVGENMGKGPHGHCAVQVQGARVLRGLDEVRRRSNHGVEAGAG